MQPSSKEENSSWIELSLDTTQEAVDWIRTLLAAIRYTGDIYITKYVEPDAGSPGQATDQADWEFTICLYLPNQVSTSAQVEAIADQLATLHRTGLSTELQWTVVQQKPGTNLSSLVHRIGQRFVVLAPEVVYPSKRDDLTLRLKPSLAFGSGLHPATMMSLRLIERYVLPTMNVLDLGSGSGILSVAMAKLGAQVLAIDNDRLAVEATQEAALCNGVEQQITALEGSLGQGSELGHWMGGETSHSVPMIEASDRFDLIVANILARVHIALADNFRQALGRTQDHPRLLITAGFTTDYEDEVTHALAEVGFEMVDSERLDEWVGLVHRLKVE